LSAGHLTGRRGGIRSRVVSRVEGRCRRGGLRARGIDGRGVPDGGSHLVARFDRLLYLLFSRLRDRRLERTRWARLYGGRLGCRGIGLERARCGRPGRRLGTGLRSIVLARAAVVSPAHADGLEGGIGRVWLAADERRRWMVGIRSRTM